MSTEIVVTYTRPSLDVEWIFFDPSVTQSAEETARAVKLQEWTAQQVSAGNFTVEHQFSEDQLSFTYKHVFPDQATKDSVTADWEAYLTAECDGIRPLTEAFLTDWCAATGCTVTSSN